MTYKEQFENWLITKVGIQPGVVYRSLIRFRDSTLIPFITVTGTLFVNTLLENNFNLDFLRDPEFWKQLIIISGIGSATAGTILGYRKARRDVVYQIPPEVK